MKSNTNTNSHQKIEALEMETDTQIQEHIKQLEAEWEENKVKLREVENQILQLEGVKLTLLDQVSFLFLFSLL